MGAATIQQMADRIAGLIGDRLGLRGLGLADTLRRHPRALPRALRAEAALLAQAAEDAAHPRLLVQIDEARVAAAYDRCLRHLQGIDRGAGPRGRAIRAGLVLLVLAVLAALAISGLRPG
jgi:hypothetical protein